MGARAVVGKLHVPLDPVFREPGRERGMAVRVETGIDVQGNNFKRKRHNAPADQQNLEQDKAVHAAGNGHTHARAGMKHSGLLHEFAGQPHAAFLGIGKGKAGHGRLEG